MIDTLTAADVDKWLAEYRPSQGLALTLAQQRIAALEKLNGTLAAEIDRMRPVVEAAVFWNYGNYREVDMIMIAENKLSDAVDVYESSGGKDGAHGIST